MTGELVNYSNEPGQYDEPEGIFPDGAYTLVGSSRHNDSNSRAHIDLYKLKLDPVNPSWERLTYFNVEGVYKAANPVVSDDGRYIAFQVAELSSRYGYHRSWLSHEAPQRKMGLLKAG